VLYEMLTGERPFRGDNHASLIQSILHDDPRPPDSSASELPEVVGPVIEKLLCKAPEGRYASAEALQGDLRALRTGDPPSLAIRQPPPESRRASPARRGSAHSGTRSRVPALLLGLAVVAGGAWLASNPPGAGEGRIERLGVMPFENRTGDPEQQHLVDGIHEALIAQLGGIAALRIIPGTPTMSDGGGGTGVQETAHALNVDALVDGSVFRDGDRLTVTTRLRAVSPERSMVAESHEGDVGEILEIARRAARSIAAEIDAPLSTAEETRLAAPARVSPEAYEAYSWGRFHIERRDREGIELARNYFQTAVDADPTFALAYAGLADTYSQAGNWGLARPSETFPRARALAETALRIDSTVAEAYTSLASVSFLYDWNWEETERLARKAIELNPSFVPAYAQLSQVLTVMERREELWAERERAQALRHLPLQSDMASAFGAYLRRDFDQVIERSREAREFDSGLWQASWLICMALAHKGLHSEAIRECEGAAARFEGNPMVLGGLGHAYASAGMEVEAERVAGEMAELAREVYVGPSLRAFIYAALGDRDRAFEWLDRAVDERDVLLVRVDFPFFDPLRTDPRFAALLERMGIERG
jgi:TolB-like protein